MIYRIGECCYDNEDLALAIATEIASAAGGTGECCIDVLDTGPDALIAGWSQHACVKSAAALSAERSPDGTHA